MAILIDLKAAIQLPDGAERQIQVVHGRPICLVPGERGYTVHIFWASAWRAIPTTPFQLKPVRPLLEQLVAGVLDGTVTLCPAA